MSPRGARGLDATARGRNRRGVTFLDAWPVFAVSWSLATLFHVWVNTRSEGVLRQPTLLGVSHVVLAVLALAILWRPRSLAILALLALTGVASVWLEAPVLGNHWLLAGFVDIGLLAALAVSGQPRGTRRDMFVPTFTALARATLIAFYAFAAFAKLNHAFINPRVSCSVLYSDELLRALHMGHIGTGSAVAHVLPWAIVLIEVAIPLLLIVRRTRIIGVSLGLVYHSLIALDATHLFSDFSSVLIPLFITFLPSAYASDVVDFVQRRRRSIGLARNALTIASVVTLLSLWIARGQIMRRLFLNGRVWIWLVVDVAILILVGTGLARIKARSEPRLQMRPKWLALVPALVVLNGLTPYLELKTAYGWNMYANLETVDGHSNHLLLPGTLPLTGVQRDLVRVQATNDGGLAPYVREGYDLPFLQLRSYLSRNPKASLIYDRAGVRHIADPASADPDLVRAVPDWAEKLSAFRAVDRTRPVRCQPSLFPAH